MSSFKHEKADDSSGFLLWKLTSLWQGKLKLIFDGHGITQTQYAILASIKWFEESKKGTTQAELVEHTKIDKMTLSKAIRGLEEELFLERERSQTDSRSVSIKLTKLGRDQTKKIIKQVEEADELFFSCLGSESLKTFKELALKIINHQS